MKLIFKEKILSLFGSYEIYNELDEIEYIVKGTPSFGFRLEIYNKDDQYLGRIEEEPISLMPKCSLYIGEDYIGLIKQKLSLLKPKFILDFNNWKVTGDIMGWNYTVIDEVGNIIMTTQKKIFHLIDFYEIEIFNPENAIYSLMIVLAIDINKSRQNSNIYK